MKRSRKVIKNRSDINMVDYLKGVIKHSYGSIKVLVKFLKFTTSIL